MTSVNDFAAALRATTPGTSTRRGLWLGFSTPTVLEQAESVLPEWLGVDLQHGAITLSNLEPLLRGTTRAVLVRIPSHDPALVQRVIDAGVAGVIVPTVNTVDEARRLVDAAYLPPRGRRSAGFARRAVSGPSTQPVLLAMVETRAGLEHAADIAAVDGIDGLFIGPYDLSLSLGCAVSDPELVKAIGEVAVAARAHGRLVGAFTGNRQVESEIPALDLLALDSDIGALLVGLRVLFPSDAKV